MNPAAPIPHPIEVLAHSPVTCRRVPSFSDVAYYTTTSGAGVFDSGTGSWVPNLTTCADASCRVRNDVVLAVTTNLLRAYALGPAGLQHPAVENIAGLHEYGGDPIAHPPTPTTTKGSHTTGTTGTSHTTGTTGSTSTTSAAAPD